MASDYLIVHKKLLPKYYEQVIDAREMLTNHEAETVTEAVKMVGISRNTFYKYKDYVFRTDETHTKRKAAVNLILFDRPGALSDVLKILSELDTSILTISQSLPVAQKASVTITIDITSMNCTNAEMIDRMKKCPSISSVYLDSIE